MSKKIVKLLLSKFIRVNVLLSIHCVRHCFRVFSVYYISHKLQAKRKTNATRLLENPGLTDRLDRSAEERVCSSGIRYTCLAYLSGVPDSEWLTLVAINAVKNKHELL